MMDRVFGTRCNTFLGSSLDGDDADFVTSTLRSANETQRVCAQTRDDVVEAEKRIAEIKGEMQYIEKSFKDRNTALNFELQEARKEANDYRVETERLKDQILRLVELDEVKNKDIQNLENKVEQFQEKLEHIFEYQTPKRTQSAGTRDVSSLQNSPLMDGVEQYGKFETTENEQEPERLRLGVSSHTLTEDEQSSEPEKRKELTEALDLQRQTLESVQQECLDLLFSTKAAHESETSNKIIEWTDASVVYADSKKVRRKQLINEIGSLECNLQSCLAELDHSELSEVSKGSNAILGAFHPSVSLYQNFLRILDLVKDDIYSESKNVYQEYQEVVRLDASTQTDERETGIEDPRELLQELKKAVVDVEKLDLLVCGIKEQVETDFDRAKKALHRLNQKHTKKAQEFSNQLQQLYDSLNSMKQSSDTPTSLIVLYQQLTNLYSQNLELVRQFQPKGNQNMTDLRVRLEKGVKDQANFTSYIASITRRESDTEGLIEQSKAQTESDSLTVPRLCNIEYHPSSKEQSADGLVCQDANTMTEKYQRLWNKYKKQSARFRTLQQLLEKEDEARTNRSEMNISKQTVPSSSSSAQAKLHKDPQTKTIHKLVSNSKSKSEQMSNSKGHTVEHRSRRERSRSSRKQQPRILQDESICEQSMLSEDHVLEGHQSLLKDKGSSFTESEDLVRSEDSRSNDPRGTSLNGKEFMKVRS